MNDDSDKNQNTNQFANLDDPLTDTGTKPQISSVTNPPNSPPAVSVQKPPFTVEEEETAAPLPSLKSHLTLDNDNKENSTAEANILPASEIPTAFPPVGMQNTPPAQESAIPTNAIPSQATEHIEKASNKDKDRSDDSGSLEPDIPSSSIPPVITAERKGGGRGKIIAGIVAVLLLVVSIPVGVFLVGQNQEIRNKAATAPGSVGTGGTCSIQADCADNLTCKDGVCKINSGLQGCCGLDSQCKTGEACNTANGTCESGKSCGSVVPPAASPLPTGPQTCDQELNCEYSQACKTSDGKDGTQTCKGVKSFNNQCVFFAGCTTCGDCNATTAVTPGSVGTMGVCNNQPDCADNLSCIDLGTGDGKRCRINSGLQGCCGLDSQCKTGEVCSTTNNNGSCQSNRSCVPAQSSAPAPSAGGGGTTPPQVGQCVGVVAYDLSDHELSQSQLGNLQGGQFVRFVVKAQGNSNFTKARFRVRVDNNAAGSWNESTNTNTNGFYWEYQIPTSGYSFSVDGQLYNSATGQWM